jgi:hypothetical protein
MFTKARKRGTKTVDLHLPVNRDERALQLAFVLAPFAPRVARIPLWRVVVCLGGFVVLCAWSVVSAVIVSRPYWSPLYARLVKDGDAMFRASETASPVVDAPAMRAEAPGAMTLEPVRTESAAQVVGESGGPGPIELPAALAAEGVPSETTTAPSVDPLRPAEQDGTVTAAGAAVGSMTEAIPTTAAPVADTPAATAVTPATMVAEAAPSTTVVPAPASTSHATPDVGYSFHTTRSVKAVKGGGFLLQDFVASTYAEAINVKFRMAGTSGKLQRGSYSAKATFEAPDGRIQSVEPAGGPGDLSYAVRNFVDRSHTFARPAPGARLVSLSVVVKDEPGNVAATFDVPMAAK